MASPHHPHPTSTTPPRASRLHPLIAHRRRLVHKLPQFHCGARSTAMSRPIIHLPTHRAQAETHTDEEQLEKAVDQLPNPLHRPASGRNTALGRRVEKPAP